MLSALLFSSCALETHLPRLHLAVGRKHPVLEPIASVPGLGTLEPILIVKLYGNPILWRGGSACVERRGTKHVPLKAKS